MISTLWNKSKRHRNKLILFGSAITLSYGAYKLYNFVNEKYIKDNGLIYKIKKAEYFKDMLTNIDNIKANFYSIIEKEIDTYLDHDKIAAKLGISENNIQNEQNQEPLDGATKFTLFKQMKILSFTKFILLQYYWSVISVLVSVQMSIIAGYLFNNQISQNFQSWWFKNPFNSQDSTCLSDQYQRDFINFSIKYLTESLPAITDAFLGSITSRLDKVSLKKFLTNDELTDLLQRLHIDLERIFTENLQQSIHSYIPRMISCDNSPGDVFIHVFSPNNSIVHFHKLLERIKMVANRQLAELVFTKPIESSNKVPLAKIIPFLWNFDKCRKSVTNDCIDLYMKEHQYRNLLFSIFELSINSCQLKLESV